MPPKDTMLRQGPKKLTARQAGRVFDPHRGASAARGWTHGGRCCMVAAATHVRPADWWWRQHSGLSPPEQGAAYCAPPTRTLSRLGRRRRWWLVQVGEGAPLGALPREVVCILLGARVELGVRLWLDDLILPTCGGHDMAHDVGVGRVCRGQGSDGGRAPFCSQKRAASSAVAKSNVMLALESGSFVDVQPISGLVQRCVCSSSHCIRQESMFCVAF